MAIGRGGGGISKKVSGRKNLLFGISASSKLNDRGLGKDSRTNKPISEKIRLSRAKRAKERKQALNNAVANEILSAWPEVPEEIKTKSMNAIAQHLLRRSYVTSVRSTKAILIMLEALARQKKISLPAKHKKKPAKKK